MPTPIVYDIVKVGTTFGNIYEYCDATDLSVVMQNDKEHLDDYVKQFVQAIKKVHKIELNPSKTDSIKQQSLEVLPLLVGEGKLLNNEEYEKIKKIFELIPDSNAFSQGDCHPGNAKYKDGVITFIDLSTSGRGHPIFDLVTMFIMYNITCKDPQKRNTAQGVREFSDDELKRIYDTFIKEYFGTEDQKLIEKSHNLIKAVAMSRILFAEVAMPGVIPRQNLEYFKGLALSLYDSGLEPPCF